MEREIEFDEFVEVDWGCIIFHILRYLLFTSHSSNPALGAYVDPVVCLSRTRSQVCLL